MVPASTAALLRDPAIVAVLERLWTTEEEQRRRSLRSPTHERRLDPDPFRYPTVGFSLHPEQAELAYMLVRATAARLVLDVACSLGVSTLFLAAALRDSGGGRVIATEIVPAKVAAARQNVEEAGLGAYVEVLEGDARVTLAARLAGTGRSVDVVLFDGWPAVDGRSLARDVLDVVEPHLRHHAVVVDDNGEADYLAHVRDPANGYRSLLLPTGGGAELSLWERGE